MAIDELERTALVNTLVDKLGEEPAATLMKTVYPDGTDFLATKSDLASLRTELLGRMDSAIARQTRTMLLTMAAFMVPIWVPLYINLLA